MEWSKLPPNKAGWYWVRRGKYRWQTLVKVTASPGEGERLYFVAEGVRGGRYGFDEIWYDVTKPYRKFSWLGPIEEPPFEAGLRNPPRSKE